MSDTSQRCTASGHEIPELDPRTRCPQCGGLLEIRHAPPGVSGAALRRLFDERGGGGGTGPHASGVWRFREIVLPTAADAILTYPEGNTPLLARRGEDGFAVAPHTRSEGAAPHAPARVERRPERVPTLGRGLVIQLQQPAAARAPRVRIGLGNFAAAARAHLPGGGGGGGAHAPASFSTSFRMPPAVTAGPAPGPVITSGFFL